MRIKVAGSLSEAIIHLYEFQLIATPNKTNSFAMDSYNTRPGNKAPQEEKRPVEEKKADHEHHEHEEGKECADTGKFGHEEHESDSTAKTHSTSYTD